MKDEYLALLEKALQIVIRFATSYLCKVVDSSMTVIKNKY